MYNITTHDTTRQQPPPAELCSRAIIPVYRKHAPGFRSRNSFRTEPSGRTEGGERVSGGAGAGGGGGGGDNFAVNLVDVNGFASPTLILFLLLLLLLLL